MIDRRDVIAAAHAMQNQCVKTARDLGSGGVAGEEDFSGQLVGRLKATFDNLRTPTTAWTSESITEPQDKELGMSVRFSARQLNKRSEEPHLGADLVMVLNVRGVEYKISKGLLAQAKLLDVGGKLDQSNWDRLKLQCKKMLDATASSFVFLYHASGVTVLPATVVEASTRRDLHELRVYPDHFLFEDFLSCWIGDPRLQATTREALAMLRAQAMARNALMINASIEGDRVARPSARP